MALVDFLVPRSRFQLEFVLANQITKQTICCINKTASGEEDENKCPGPKVERRRLSK